MNDSKLKKVQKFHIFSEVSAISYPLVKIIVTDYVICVSRRLIPSKCVVLKFMEQHHEAFVAGIFA